MILLLLLIGFGVAALAPWLYSIFKERTVWVLAAYPLAGQWLLTARAENLTDKVYENVSGYNTSPRAVYVALRYAAGK